MSSERRYKLIIFFLFKHLIKSVCCLHVCVHDKTKLLFVQHNFKQTMQRSLWPGAADVPAVLWHRHLQCSTVCRLKKGVRQEPGKDQRTNQDNNPSHLIQVLRISITTAPTMLTAIPSIDQQQPTCCLRNGGGGVGRITDPSPASGRVGVVGGRLGG